MKWLLRGGGGKFFRGKYDVGGGVAPRYSDNRSTVPCWSFFARGVKEREEAGTVSGIYLFINMRKRGGEGGCVGIFEVGWRWIDVD